ncbi:alpha-tocopherol transfer protein isoform X2 [Bemisia tabaci]|uniref:alpha-tocopherol transfer protein isoform X2 n=1 Tax=Bemisia tabaci TaxID=7038 RepID=UPI003B284C12
MELISIDEELKKNPRLTLEDIKYLRDWIEQEGTAPRTISDVQLALFLHCCDYDLDTTKKIIKLNYRWRAEQPDYFTKRNFQLDTRLVQTLDVISYMISPNRSSSGELILLVRVHDNIDMKNFDFLGVVKLFFMFMDMALVHYGTSNGVVIIYDCEPLNFAIVRRVQVGALRTLFFYIQLHLHRPGSTTLYDHLTPNLVPKQFGGEDESTLDQMQEKSKELLKTFEPWFKQEEESLVTFMQGLKLEKQQSGGWFF